MSTLSQLVNLSGRVSVITGGAGHIGYAMCQSLAELGSHIVVVDRQPLQEDLAAELEAHGGNVLCLAEDLAEEAAAAQIVTKVLDAYGRLDVLINNAAFVGSNNLQGWATPFAEQSVETWKKAMDVNLTAVFALSQAAAPALTASGNGAIINVASIYGVVGPDWDLYAGTKMGNPAAYAASKGGIIQLTRWLSTTLAPDVRVNAITPGGVARGQPEAFVEKYNKRTPLGRMAVEDDFKGAVALLASDASRYITGHNLMVDGGWSVW